ncbi:MAG: ribosome maturation factor RimP [Eubacterium sp.]|nr:ribosome maturation factor RimP [Eubacterium sp.]
MSKASVYEDKTRQYIAPVLEGTPITLVDVEFVKESSNYYLRVYIDKPGGVTIEDCETVSRAYNTILDEKDYIEEVYTFEVSSPGLERPLKKDSDLEMSIGKLVRIKTYKKIDNQKEFVGYLKSFDDDNINIEEEKGDMSFSRKDISLIRLEYDPNAEEEKQ